MSIETISEQYEREHADRLGTLEIARECSRFTMPPLMPRETQNRDSYLLLSNTSLPTTGLQNLVSRIQFTMFPPGTPWFEFRMPAALLYGNAPTELKQAAQERLFTQELLLNAIIRQGGPLTAERGRRHKPGFAAEMYTVLLYVVCTGDCLFQVNDRYDVVVYRRDQYVTHRAPNGMVLWHIIKEKIDALALTDDELSRLGLSDQNYREKKPHERMVDLFTRVSWDVRANEWVIEKEINKLEAEPARRIKVSPYVSVAYHLLPNEHYGRGFVEMLLPEIRSNNQLSRNLLDWAAMCSRQHPVLDESSPISEEEFVDMPNGKVLRGRVQAGLVQDIGHFRVDRAADFSVVYESKQVSDKRLSRDFLLESEFQPRGERVTATQIRRIAAELEGALGGAYASIAEEMLTPMLARYVDLAVSDGVLDRELFDKLGVEAVPTTGNEVIYREFEASKLLDFAQVLALMPEAAAQKVDAGVMIGELARLRGISVPGLVKSQQQIAAENQAAVNQQLQVEAGTAAIRAAETIATR